MDEVSDRLLYHYLNDWRWLNSYGSSQNKKAQHAKLLASNIVNLNVRIANTTMREYLGILQDEFEKKCLWFNDLNKMEITQSDRETLRELGLGSSKAEQLFWALVQPRSNSIGDYAALSSQGPQLYLNAQDTTVQSHSLPLPPEAQSAPILTQSAMFRQCLRSFNRTGVSADQHLFVNPLLKANEADFILVPSYCRYSGPTESKISIKYVLKQGGENNSSTALSSSSSTSSAASGYSAVLSGDFNTSF